MESFNPGFVEGSVVRQATPEPGAIESQLQDEDDMVYIDRFSSEAMPDSPRTPKGEPPTAVMKESQLTVNTSNRFLQSPPEIKDINSNSPKLKPAKSADDACHNYVIQINTPSTGGEDDCKVEVEQISDRPTTLIHRGSTPPIPNIAEKKLNNEIKPIEAKKTSGCWGALTNCFKGLTFFSGSKTTVSSTSEMELPSNLNPFPTVSPTITPRGLKQQ